MATRQNLLSPEELSALSEGLKDGSLETDTGFNTGVRVRKHDHRLPIERKAEA